LNWIPDKDLFTLSILILHLIALIYTFIVIPIKVYLELYFKAVEDDFNNLLNLDEFVLTVIFASECNKDEYCFDKCKQVVQILKSRYFLFRVYHFFKPNYYTRFIEFL
jgi:hypothetical protein